jgi:hypothetical protein
MQIYERINQILKSKGLKKKDFLNKFLSLNPTLKSSGESPSIPSIYNYLNGNREIKAELISFIVKALEVSEQELFLDDDNSADLLKELLNKQSRNSALNGKNRLIMELINLCEYTPEPLLEQVLSMLERNKEMYAQSMKRLSEINLSKF